MFILQPIADGEDYERNGGEKVVDKGYTRNQEPGEVNREEAEGEEDGDCSFGVHFKNPSNSEANSY